MGVCGEAFELLEILDHRVVDEFLGEVHELWCGAECLQNGETLGAGGEALFGEQADDWLERSGHHGRARGEGDEGPDGTGRR